MKNKKFSIFTYVGKYAAQYLIGIVFLFVVDYLSLYVPEYTGDIIELLYQGTTFDTVANLVYKIAIVSIVMSACRFGWRYFILGSSRKIEYELRKDMFGHLELLSASYFNQHKTGDLMAHFTNDLEAIREAVGFAVITTFDAVVMTVMTVYKMIVYVDFRLTVIAFIPMIIIAVGGYFFGIIMEKRHVARQESFSYLSDKVQESISGIRVIKAFVQEEEDMKSFEEANLRNKKANLDVVKLRAGFFPLLETLIAVSVLLNLVLGGKMVIDGTITISQFVTFNSYIGMLVWPMIAAGDCLNTYSLGFAALGRIGAIFAEKPEIVNKENCVDEPITGKITFNNLTFTYPDGTYPVLKNMNLTIEAGETLAILGRTGSGKSSLSDLLLRVYDVESGMLKIDDRNIDEYSLDRLHQDIAYVPQDNFLFSETLEENIAFGLEERIKDNDEIRDKIIDATKAACIHDNIMDFPKKYQTMVGERGVTLSGGQKQRSSIARALVKDSPILILDDSLSAVDTDTEEQILNNLKRIRKDKTTIIIAHRISSLQSANHIIVLTDGEITEYGTHDELLALNGFYADIYHKQQLEAQLAQM